MALTNFAALTSEQLTGWERDVWKAARNLSFLNNFAGEMNAMVHRVTELTESEKGTRAVMTLVADAEGDGVVGDNTLEGNEEALRSFDQVIQIDQLRHAHRSKGRMSEQKSVVKFRKEAKDTLSYWLADRWDQMGLLTLSGVAYSQTNRGAVRIGSPLNELSFAADVTAPSANRYTRWKAAGGLITSGATNTDVLAADTPSWKMLVELKAYAVDQYIKPLRSSGGIDMYAVIMTPRGIAKLKQDTQFLDAWKLAQERGSGNPIFKGTGHGPNGFYIDGLFICEYRHVYNTTGTATKWGAGNLVEGQRVILAGAQALGIADIGAPRWVEKEFDYNNQPGIAVGKICGFKKPVFRSQVTGTDEDFGVIVCDTAI